MAILGGLPLAGAALVSAAAWAARVAMGLPRTPRQERIDPFRVGEPWRRFVQDAQQAQGRFEETVRRTHAGPLQGELDEIGARIAEGVREAWRVAQQGHLLEEALGRMDLPAAKQDLARVGKEIDRYPGGTAPAHLVDTREAIEAQLQAADRLAGVATSAHARLRLVNAQLDEAVARAIELSVSRSTDAVDLSPVAQSLEGIVDELEALRQGLEEAGGASAAAGGNAA